MTPARAIVLLTPLLVALGRSADAQEQAGMDISGDTVFDVKTGKVTATNVVIRYKDAVLTADSASVDQKSHEVIATGRVRIQQGELTWVGEQITYNFESRQIVAQEFRTGRAPVFAAGKGLHGDLNSTNRTINLTNSIYSATNAFITLDDVQDPAVRIRARHIRIVPGDRIEATHATLLLGDVPVLYFPYYARSLAARANNFNFTPGYRSLYGPFVLGSYNWFLNENLDGTVHLDYREKRGVGAGLDSDFRFGRWGDGSVRYYYARDRDAETNLAGANLPENRQRAQFIYQGAPFTNLTVKSTVNYQGDSDFVKDFFTGDYRSDPQPATFVEVNKFWDNFSLAVLARPQLNDFLETVERLPEVRLAAFRQEIGPTPLYYESDSSAGYYRRRFAGADSPFASTNADFSAGRADTYHQLTLPCLLFGWLNLTPRAGGRFTYYSEVDGGGAGSTFRTNADTARGVFNTGAEIAFKASRLWPAVRNQALDLDGLRHIVEPSANYVYVPEPNYRPNQLPQFDYELPSLQQLPIEFPDYNAVDSIDSQNVIRLGLRNRLQTKRDGQLEDLLNWQLFIDWRLRPRGDQETFADLYSDLTLRPRSWITLQSLTRFDPNDSRWRMSLQTLTLEPNDVWSWTIGYFYLRDDFSGSPTALGQGNNLVTSSLYCRLNENWGLRATHHLDVREARMQEQLYTVYRDMRSWTAALTGGVRNNGTGSLDYSVAFTFSVKAMPKYGVGGDTVRPHSLLGQ